MHFNQYFRTHYRLGVAETNINLSMIQPFYIILNRYLQQQGIPKSHLARRTGLDRRTIYKIYHEPDYLPSRRIVYMLGLGLHLELAQFESFIHAAGYHLSCHRKMDVVIQYCLEHHLYTLTTVDLYLEKVGEKPLQGFIF